METEKHERLIAWMKAHNLRQRELAEQLGVLESTISQVATGERPPSANLRFAFAERYGMDEAKAVFNGDSKESA